MIRYLLSRINSHIRDKVLLDLPNHANKKELEHATGVDTFNVAAKSDFITLKTEVGKQILINWSRFRLV